MRKAGIEPITLHVGGRKTVGLCPIVGQSELLTALHKAFCCGPCGM